LTFRAAAIAPTRRDGAKENQSYTSDRQRTLILWLGLRITTLQLRRHGPTYLRAHSVLRADLSVLRVLQGIIGSFANAAICEAILRELSRQAQDRHRHLKKIGVAVGILSKFARA